MGRAFEYRKDRKMKRWGMMSKMFTKIGREISIAVKEGGADPSTNPRLRIAIQNSKAVNMPKATVDAAIKRATSKDEKDLEELVYEGYGPHGIAILVECLSDNPTRTVAAMRLYLSRSNGSLGTSGSVSYMFDRKGEFTFLLGERNMDDLELALIEGGADEIEVETNEEGATEVYVLTKYEDYGTMQKTLEDLGIEVTEAGLQRFATTTKELDEKQREDIEKLIEKFEDDDDVQKVFHTMA
jgi:YebC/PmpR family DNA-binding regulatory protein